MDKVECSCGEEISVSPDEMGEAIPCPRCDRLIRLIGTSDAEPPDRSHARLTICEGPERVGEQLVLASDKPVEFGGSTDRPIALPGENIPPRMGRLVPTDSGWRLEIDADDLVIVNGEPVRSHELATGDVINIGPYELEYADSTAHAAAETSAPARRGPATASLQFAAPPPSQTLSAKCPACGRSLPMDAKICVDCGIDIRTGRALLTAREVDENTLYGRAETAARLVSWVVPFGVYPIASEGLGSARPFVTWALALATAVISLWFWSHNLGVSGVDRNDRAIVLWAGHHGATPVHPSSVVDAGGDFHPWQVITYGFLHDGILPMAVNVAFLLVLGSRVNALIGNVRMLILYPLLLAAMAGVELWAGARHPPHAVTGAGGAVMAIAGVYLVLFPLHRVHMVAWIRTGFSTGLQLAHNVFAVRGSWVVLIYAAVDALATLLDPSNPVTPWAHFIGLPVGFAIGLGLLLARQADARGGDLISAILGRRAWALLGRPGARAGA